MNELKKKHETTEFSAEPESKFLKHVEQGVFKQSTYNNAMRIKIGLVLALDDNPNNLELKQTKQRWYETKQPKKIANGSNYPYFCYISTLKSLTCILDPRRKKITLTSSSFRFHFSCLLPQNYPCGVRMGNSLEKYGNSQAIVLASWSGPGPRITKRKN